MSWFKLLTALVLLGLGIGILFYGYGIVPKSVYVPPETVVLGMVLLFLGIGLLFWKPGVEVGSPLPFLQKLLGPFLGLGIMYLGLFLVFGGKWGPIWIRVAGIFISVMGFIAFVIPEEE